MSTAARDICLAAVIFDLDGTLLDTEPLSTQAINAVLRAHDPSASCDSVLKSSIIGLRDLDWARIVIDRTRLQHAITPSEMIQGWHHNLAKLLPTVNALPGAKELTKQLSQMGVPQAVGTSSSL